jgi:hypothetical protein
MLAYQELYDEKLAGKIKPRAPMSDRAEERFRANAQASIQASQ